MGGTEWNAYENGATFAAEVQAGLREGKTFNDFHAMEPMEAVRVRDIIATAPHEYDSLVEMGAVEWYNGYLSRWD